MRREYPELTEDQAIQLAESAHELDESLLLPPCRLLDARAAKALFQVNEVGDMAFVDLSHVAELSPAAAGVVVGFSNTAQDQPDPAVVLNLNGLRTLSPRTAKMLSRYNGGGLALNGLRKVNLRIAKNLCRLSYGQLHLNGVRRLTPTVFVQLLQTCDGVSLNGLSTLGPEFAPALATARLDSISTAWQLNLNGVTHLPEVVVYPLTAMARAISKNDAEGRSDYPVTLDGVVALESSALADEIVSRGESFRISAGGVQSLTMAAARVLATDSVSLPKVRTLSSDCAAAISTCTGVVDLGGLEVLSPQVAKAFAELRGRALHLDRLQTIAPECAACIAQAEVEHLSLNGLEWLGVRAAELLARSRACRLSLNKLADAEDLAIREIADFPGKIELGAFVRDAAAWTHFDEFSPRLLAKHPGPLDLSSIRHLTAEEARCLASHGGPNLNLDGLVELPEDVALELSRYVGKLSLCGVERISDSVASILSGYKGWAVVLRGLKVLSLYQSSVLGGIDKIKLLVPQR